MLSCIRSYNNRAAAARLLGFYAVKGSKDPRAAHKDHKKGASGLQTVLVPVTDGKSSGVSRGKKEIKSYLSAASPRLLTTPGRAWKAPVLFQRNW